MIKEEQYLLTNQEILGGLKSAINRGESLKEAMMSFYRAGYDKHEIEEAAKVYLEMNNGEQVQPVKTTPEKNEEPKKEEKEIKKPFIMPKTQKFKPLSQGEKKKKETVQKVSQYGKVKRNAPAGKIVTIVLILILALLIGILGAVVLFREELVSFFNNLFG